jgi:hypothetical protein
MWKEGENVGRKEEDNERWMDRRRQRRKEGRRE